MDNPFAANGNDDFDWGGDQVWWSQNKTLLLYSSMVEKMCGFFIRCVDKCWWNLLSFKMIGAAKAAPQSSWRRVNYLHILLWLKKCVVSLFSALTNIGGIHSSSGWLGRRWRRSRNGSDPDYKRWKHFPFVHGCVKSWWICIFVVAHLFLTCKYPWE